MAITESLTSEKVELFVQPGCTSCLRAKEFVAKHAPTTVIVDIATEPGALERLTERGILTVPVVLVGERHCFAQNVDELGKFLGIQSSHTMLPPDQLLARYDHVLDVSSTLAEQIPPALFATRAIDDRDRSLGFLAHHIVDIADRFLAGVKSGSWNKAAPDMPAHLTAGAHIARDGRMTRRQLQAFAAEVTPEHFERRVATYYGLPTAHYLLERSVWHSAQHARQLIDVFDQEGVEFDRRLDPQQLAGLPLPAAIWE